MHSSGLIENGRGGEIRTHDLLYPKQARYQATLRPDPRQRRMRMAKGFCNRIIYIIPRQAETSNSKLQTSNFRENPSIKFQIEPIPNAGKAAGGFRDAGRTTQATDTSASALQTPREDGRWFGILSRLPQRIRELRQTALPIPPSQLPR